MSNVDSLTDKIMEIAFLPLSQRAEKLIEVKSIVNDDVDFSVPEKELVDEIIDNLLTEYKKELKSKPKKSKTEVIDIDVDDILEDIKDAIGKLDEEIDNLEI